LLPDDRVLQRQAREVDRADLVDARLSQVVARLGFDQLALDDVLAALVAVEHLSADPQLIDARDRSLADLVDLREIRQTLGDVLADHGLLRKGSVAQREGQGGDDSATDKLFHSGFQESSARDVSQRLSGESWFTRVRPRLRSSRTPGAC
jgi:hypothetical protein